MTISEQERREWYEASDRAVQRDQDMVLAALGMTREAATTNQLAALARIVRDVNGQDLLTLAAMIRQARGVKLAKDLVEGDSIDVPAELVAGTENETAAEFEYAGVESVNGGWADGLAGPDQVVIYTINMVAPIVAPKDFEFTLQKDA